MGLPSNRRRFGFLEYLLPAIAESKAPPSVADELLDLRAAHSKSNQGADE
jgi:hypothetical protein